MADESTRKRKRVSKNKKKNWRKHIDINDVEEFLEDQRLQERTGGLVAEKADDALFFIDKAVESGKDEVSSRKKRREPKALRCFANLEQDPRTKASSRSRDIRTASKIEKKKSFRVKEREVKGIISATAKRAKLQRKQAVVDRKKNIRERLRLPRADYDLWGEEDAEGKTKNEDEHYLRVTRKLPIKQPAHALKKPSGVPAIEIAHPGASYNPAFDDHLELMNIAHQVEVQKDKAENKIKRQLDEKFPSTKDAPTEATWIQEMSAGLYDEGSDDEDVGDLDKLSVNPPVRRENVKTVSQRNKEKRMKELEEKRKKEKEQRIKDSEIFRLKSFKKDVAERERRLMNRARRKAELKEKNKDNPKKLGKLKFEAPDIEVKLGGELKGSLRLLKPEGNLMEDRFKSFQKRNIIEPRLPAKRKKKYKDKIFEKPSYKEITL